MSRKTYRKRKQPPPRQFPWLWLTVAAGVLLLVGGGLVMWPSAPAESPQVTGAPRLVVDQTIIDEGYVKLNKTIKTTFNLKNVGDQPLQILDEPRVELVEGC